MLRLDEAPLLISGPEYLPVETGSGLASDGLWHVATSTYMPGCSAAMVDWWFGWIKDTEQYKLWHPRDHVYSAWEGPRDNSSTYIGGHHLVHEYIGGELVKLKISFRDPAEYFGPNWRDDFEKAGCGTAICGRVGTWNGIEGASSKVAYNGHLIHLIKNEPRACRMRSRFWLGDIEGVSEKQGHNAPEYLREGLMKHATEEMAILAAQLPQLYKQFSRNPAKL